MARLTTLYQSWQRITWDEWQYSTEDITFPQ